MLFIVFSMGAQVVFTLYQFFYTTMASQQFKPYLKVLLFFFIVNFSDNGFHFCNFFLVLFQICLHFSISSNIICYLFWSPFRFFLMFSFWGLSYPFFSSFTLCDSSFLCHVSRSLILSLTSVGTAFHGIALNCVLWTVGLTLEDSLACIIAKTT